jgi:hypothetical protein
MRPISFKTKKLGLFTMIFSEPNLDIKRLPTKVGKPRNTIMGLFER